MSAFVETEGGFSRDVGFVRAVTLFFQNYFKFGGRSSRGAYWWVFLFTLIVGFITGFTDLLIYPDGKTTPLNSLASLVTLIPSIAIGVRRLHDVGKSGWWTFIALTIIGVIPLLYWYCKAGQRRTNAYGEDVEAGR